MSLRDMTDRMEKIVKDYSEKIAEYLGTEEALVKVSEEPISKASGTLGSINHYTLEITIFKNPILEIVENHFSSLRNDYGAIAGGFETAKANSFELIVVHTLGHEYGHLLQIRDGRLNRVETLIDQDIDYIDKWYEKHADHIAMNVVKYFFKGKNFKEEIPDIEKYLPKPKKLPVIKSNGNHKVLEALTIVRIICSMAKELTPDRVECKLPLEAYTLSDKACDLFKDQAGEDGKEVAEQFSKMLRCLKLAQSGSVIERGELESIKMYFIQPLENMLNESDILLISNRKLIDSYEIKFKEYIKSNTPISNIFESRCMPIKFTPPIKGEGVLSIRE